jgi:hypothetical protein
MVKRYSLNTVHVEVSARLFRERSLNRSCRGGRTDHRAVFNTTDWSLLEILEASDFLADLTKATMKAEGRGSVEL